MKLYGNKIRYNYDPWERLSISKLYKAVIDEYNMLPSYNYFDYDMQGVISSNYMVSEKMISIKIDFARIIPRYDTSGSGTLIKLYKELKPHRSFKIMRKYVRVVDDYDYIEMKFVFKRMIPKLGMIRTTRV